MISAALRDLPLAAEAADYEDGVAYCSGPECDRPVFRLGLCEGHCKQRQRQKPLAPLAEKLTPRQRFYEAITAWAECDSGDDEAYAEAERSVEYAARQAFGKKNAGEAIRKGMAAARARGVRVGRPPKLAQKEAQALVLKTGSFRAAAKKLGVHWITVWRAIRRAAVAQSDLLQSPPSGPRPRRGSR
jgi:hypothetical protein